MTLHFQSMLIIEKHVIICMSENSIILYASYSCLRNYRAHAE